MMGQKETMAVAEEIGGGTLRRMILVVTAVALMAVMLLAMAMPAFAHTVSNPHDPANPYATGTAGPGETAIYTYKAPPAYGYPAPGKKAAGGNVGDTLNGCHGPACP
jgi:hypothetical protein